MTLIDISWPLTNEMTPYRERNLFSARFFRTWEKDQARQAELKLDCHAGTHVDAPAHYVEKGKTVDQVDLHYFMGECRVLDLTAVKEKITNKELEKQSIKRGERILLKTQNSFLSPTAPFKADFVYLDKSAAAYLVQKKIKMVGIDYLGIERNQPDHDTHTLLLGNNIAIVEGLRLGRVAAGKYRLYCLPLAVKGLEAAPARAVLLDK